VSGFRIPYRVDFTSIGKVNRSMSEWSQMLPTIEAIFNEALALPEGDRQSLIESRCGENDALKAEVCSLLKACEEEELFAAARLWQARTAADAGLERKRVGAYEIDRLVGRGGMKSKHSLLIVPISRSQNALACGARTGVFTTLSQGTPRLRPVLLRRSRVDHE
jgi:hypothetical protein